MAESSYQAKSTAYDVSKAVGVSGIPGSTTVTVTNISSSGLVTRAFGATVPTDGEAGYTTGAEFHLTTGVLRTILANANCNLL